MCPALKTLIFLVKNAGKFPIGRYKPAIHPYIRPGWHFEVGRGVNEAR